LLLILLIKFVLHFFFLAFPSLFIGFFIKEIFVGFGSDFWGNAIFIKPENMNFFDAELIDNEVKIFPVQMSLSGILLAFFFYINNSKFFFFLKKIFLA